MANRFVESQIIESERIGVVITKARSINQLLQGKKRRSRDDVIKANPGGWGYTDHAEDPYASMTAAGASSLIVARNGLAEAGRAERQGIEKALASAFCWIGRDLDFRDV